MATFKTAWKHKKYATTYDRYGTLNIVTCHQNNLPKPKTSQQLLSRNPSQVLNPLASIQVKSKSGLEWGTGVQGEPGYLNELQEHVVFFWAPYNDVHH